MEQIQSLISRLKSSIDNGKSSLDEIEKANRTNNIDCEILSMASRTK